MVEPYICIDIETHKLDPRKGGHLLCAAWSTESTDVDIVADVLPDKVLEMLADPERIIISHSKFDPVWFKRMGLDVTPPYHDTMVMAHLLNENTQLSLEACADIYLHLQMDKRLVRKDKKVWFVADNGEKLELYEAWGKYREQVMYYCQRDTEATVDLYHNLKDRMVAQGWWEDFVNDHGHAKFTEVLVDMECEGIPLNEGEAEQLKEVLIVQAAEQRVKLVEDLGYEINFASPPQLRTVLFNNVWEQAIKLPITTEQRDLLKESVSKTDVDDGNSDGDVDQQSSFHFLPPNFEVTKVGRLYVYGTIMQKGLGITPKRKTETGLWSTSTPTLTTYHGGHPIVADLVAYRKTEKVIGTYLDAYPEYTYEGRLYGRFNQTGTATGRLSHSNPNLGNQPTRGELGTSIRGLFQGRFIIGDHGQLENRFMAHFSGDPVLMDVYRNGLDIHIVTAQYVFGKQDIGKEDVERDIAKTFGYAMGYGAAANKLAEIMALNGFWTELDRVKEYLNELETLYSTFFAWKRHVMADAKRNGYVKTIGGRFRRLRANYNDKHFRVRNKADRQAVNSIIQGSAADVLRMNMIDVRYAYPTIPLLNQVHDELIWEVDEHTWGHNQGLLTDLQYICENPGFDLSVPLKFEPGYCASWADKGSSIELPEEDDSEDGEG